MTPEGLDRDEGKMLRSMPGRRVKLRTRRKTNESPSYFFTIPADIGKAIERSGQYWYEVQIMEEGILYRPILLEPRLPEWMQEK